MKSRNEQTSDCFLCKPKSELVYQENAVGIALCGLGPVISGYSVVATKRHIRSAADVPENDVLGFLDFVTRVRTTLASAFGCCLITEHGRLPVCDYVAGRTDSHCYHAHFLMFPGAPDIEDGAVPHFDDVHEASSMDEALRLARSCHEYFLLSPDPCRYLVMTSPAKLTRQFARVLVAESLGRANDADWKKSPQCSEAQRMASDLSALFSEGTNL